MTYKVPQSKAKKQDTFDIAIDVDVKGKTEERTFKLPSMKYLKPATIAEAEMLPQLNGYKHLINSVAPGLFELFDDADQIEDLMEAWQEFSGVTAGESSASTDS